MSVLTAETCRVVDIMYGRNVSHDNPSKNSVTLNFEPIFVEPEKLL